MISNSCSLIFSPCPFLPLLPSFFSSFPCSSLSPSQAAVGIPKWYGPPTAVAPEGCPSSILGYQWATAFPSSLSPQSTSSAQCAFSPSFCFYSHISSPASTEGPELLRLITFPSQESLYQGLQQSCGTMLAFQLPRLLLLIRTKPSTSKSVILASTSAQKLLFKEYKTKEEVTIR